ncbi:Heterogeneous nuclear ribonucleoprotein Q [Monoraphidium neglectum]|uniref:Heterogeneous nuclear ribonucleoprotein Q n=1 Tax=Monoraphidium neglectum TaxID=145388 RepID=A0A0D2KNR2_9CHLO|nr:Heterogeneous nuclear ribonucleoprotein Q [Monoraphidium neglectum]KIY97283.1 Heterogeneous nuclear ribonucleoprotein Q [Monoraphidium neglectum]|eukprot:XP_013896303.1 Heterogeneous nuclear ribonucleoprotein Q [Monoraphidium neglectum]
MAEQAREEDAIDYGDGDAEEPFSEDQQAGDDAEGDADAADGPGGAAAMEEEEERAATPAPADGEDGAGNAGEPAAEDGGGAHEGGGGGNGAADGGAADQGKDGRSGGGGSSGGGAGARDGALEERDPLKLPPHGTEVFVASLPHEASEEKVREFVASAGLKTHSVRIPRPGPDAPRASHNKGFAFAVYFTKEDAAAAVEKLNGRLLLERVVRASISVTNNRLFIGNIPRTITPAALKETLAKEVAGLEEVDLVSDREHPDQNRGFGFLTFYNHAAAEKARRRLEAGFS